MISSLAVAVVDQRRLRGHAEHREVLAVEVGDEDVVLAQVLAEVVQAAVGVLLDPPEPGQVVLEAVVVAVAEQAHAELVVLEQEAAEIGRERLDADADRVEVVALGDVAEVVVDEGFLDAEEVVGAGVPVERVGVEEALLLRPGVVVVEGQGQRGTRCRAA